MLLENVVTLVNLGMRRTGMAPGTEDERDLDQVRLAVEGVRAVLPLVEQAAPEQAQPIRDALSQLQLAYVRLGGGTEAGPSGSTEQGPGPGPEPGSGQTPPSTPGAGPGQTPPAPAAEDAPDPSKPGEPGPAQRSGRLWVPGQ